MFAAMLPPKRVLLILLVILNVKTCFGSVQVLYSRQENKYLRNHVIKKLYVKGEIECGAYCAREESCQSINFQVVDDALDICELNNATERELTHINDLLDKEGVIFLKVVDWSSSYQKQGKSCADILQRSKAKWLPSGEYRIRLDQNEPIKVFCDMKTDGGGWTLITNIVLPDSSGFTWSLATDYRKISDYTSKRLGLSVPALEALRHKMPFTQLMFHCHKMIPGRTFHVATKQSTLGHDVVRYFTGQTNSCPKSCGSFTHLPDDNSTMARECSKWGYESGKYSVGKWHYAGYPVANRLINQAAFVAGKAHWLLPNEPGGRWECDDYTFTSGFARTAGDFWKIFVR